jgi:hypothetical protein
VSTKTPISTFRCPSVEAVQHRRQGIQDPQEKRYSPGQGVRKEKWTGGAKERGRVTQSLGLLSGSRSLSSAQLRPVAVDR